MRITAFAAGCASLALTVTLAPRAARAFWWPFSQDVHAAPSAITPSASTPVLMAPKNGNPNAGTPIALSMSENMALVPYGGPSGTLVAVASSTPPDRISIYVVRAGDTLSEIAHMFNVSVNTIIWANDLKNARDVHPGDTLVILPVSGVERTVVKGDTLKSIAKKFNADADEIAAFNGLDVGAPLAVGSTIIIPGGEIAPPPTPVAVPGKIVKEPLLGGGGPAIAGYFSNPIPGALFTQGLHGWNGVDLGASRGTPILAAADGIVIVARNNGAWNGGYGNYVVISHPNGTQTLYSHMSRAAVTIGRSVSAGELIGYVGSTGYSTGPHLHFEVRGAANPFRNCVMRTVCQPQ